MKHSSLLTDLTFSDERPLIKPLLESAFSKEIRISFKEGQVMKKHQTAYPIVVEIFEGEIDFGVNNEMIHMVKGDIISLEGGIPHDLKALKQSIVRLTLSKKDQVDRVQGII